MNRLCRLGLSTMNRLWTLIRDYKLYPIGSRYSRFIVASTTWLKCRRASSGGSKWLGKEEISYSCRSLSNAKRRKKADGKKAVRLFFWTTWCRRSFPRVDVRRGLEFQQLLWCELRSVGTVADLAFRHPTLNPGKGVKRVTVERGHWRSLDRRPQPRVRSSRRTVDLRASRRRYRAPASRRTGC